MFTQAYLEPSQTSTMQFFTKIVFLPLAAMNYFCKKAPT